MYVCVVCSIFYVVAHILGAMYVPLCEGVFANFRNKLCDSEQLGYLGLCPKLVALEIHGNPFCSLLSTSIEVMH